MTYVVRATAAAWRDVDEQVAWIRSTSSATAAARWYDEWFGKLEKLPRVPNGRAVAPESRAIPGVVIRQMLAVGFRSLFVVKEDVVYVLHVRRASRRPAKPAELRQRFEELLRDQHWPE